MPPLPSLGEGILELQKTTPKDMANLMIDERKSQVCWYVGLPATNKSSTYNIN